MTCQHCGMDHDGVDWDAVDLASARLEAARDDREIRVGMAGIRPLTVDSMFSTKRPTLAEAARRLGPRVAVAVQAAAVQAHMEAVVKDAKAQTPGVDAAMRRWKGLS